MKNVPIRSPSMVTSSDRRTPVCDVAARRSGTRRRSPPTSPGREGGQRMRDDEETRVTRKLSRQLERRRACVQSQGGARWHITECSCGYCPFDGGLGCAQTEVNALSRVEDGVSPAVHLTYEVPTVQDPEVATNRHLRHDVAARVRPRRQSRQRVHVRRCVAGASLLASPQRIHVATRTYA